MPSRELHRCFERMLDGLDDGAQRIDQSLLDPVWRLVLVAESITVTEPPRRDRDVAHQSPDIPLAELLGSLVSTPELVHLRIIA